MLDHIVELEKELRQARGQGEVEEESKKYRIHTVRVENIKELLSAVCSPTRTAELLGVPYMNG
jgi:hypothetical protein